MENHRRNQIEIEMNEEALAKAKPVFTTECCIYRVPHKIRNLNQGAYTPNVVSIGPFHYGNNNLRRMESQKQFNCHKFIERAKVETTFDNLMRCLQELEPSVRACYSHDIKLTSHELCNVILVDCGFIFELFLREHLGEWTDDDAIPSKPWLTTNIKLDLLLLENQLPFFVLEKLYNLAFASRQNDSETTFPSFLDITFDFFGYYYELKLSTTDAAATSIKHFTDMLRTFHLQPSNGTPPSRGHETVTHLNSATDLNEAGVEFEVNKQSRCLLNLEILRGHRLCDLVGGTPRLKIPKITVVDRTETLFRNMVALEQCHYPRDSYITDYVAILSFLIKTGKDVDLLVKKKIIVNWLEDNDAVAKLFKGLWKNIVQVGFNSDYVAICRDLESFCVHPWYTRKATLKRDYCNTPWKKLASFAAILVIILTIIQTLCSILQVL